MPATPNITLIVNLQDLSGADIDNGAVVIALCGFGQVVPRIPGTSMIAQVGPRRFTLVNGTATIKLWGNDQIDPDYTYYAIEVQDASQNVVQSGMYVFTGSETIDLSVATQIDVAPTPPSPVPPGNYFADEVVPTGIIDGTNPTFTLPQAPSPAASITLFKNGQRMTRGVAFTLVEETITYATAYIPQPAGDGNPGDSHICSYRYAVS